MSWWPPVIYATAVTALMAVILVVSRALGEHHSEPGTGLPYESGMTTTGRGRERISIQFYLVAMFFVIFDLEAAFLFAWAIAARALGSPAYIEVVLFAGVLVIALLYLWRDGALDWNPTRRPVVNASRLGPPEPLSDGIREP